MQPRHLPPGRQRIRVQDLLPIDPGCSGVLTGHKEVGALHCFGSFKSKTELVVRVSSSLEVRNLWIGDPSGVGLANPPGFVVFASNPFGTPFFRVQQPSLPPARFAKWVGLAVTVPNFHTP